MMGAIERFGLGSLANFCRLTRADQEYLLAYHVLRECEERQMNDA